MQQISPSEIGLRVDYDSKNWTPWNPDKWVIHYGGGPVSNHNAGPAREMAVLRAWEWWHINGQGWLGIAYNYAIGQSGNLYRLRGEQRSGATSGDADEDGIPENHEARAVVFILGGDQEPSDAALATFSKFWATDPMRVIGHRDSTSTPCPGEHLYDWIQAKGYDDMVDRKTAVDPNPDLLPNVEKAREVGIYSQYTQPGGLIFADELATFFARAGIFDLPEIRRMVGEIKKAVDSGRLSEGKTWTKKQITALIAGSAAGGATAAEVIQEIITRLGG